ncbi:MAG: enoyl-CoA hydratase-related protein [Pseudomonadota bacterium]
MIRLGDDNGEGIVRVALDRPEKLNALTVRGWSDLADAFEALAENSAVRAVLLESTSERAFCVGADISEFQSERATRDQALGYAQHVLRGVEAIAHCPHPVVAAIKGHCVGGGLEIAAACDVRIAREDARFSVPIRRLGLTVDYPELSGLMRLVGPSNALEMLFEGRLLDADEALTKGLVNRVLPADAFDAEVDATLVRIATGAPLVARWHKRMVRRLEDPKPLSDADRLAPFEVFDSEDYQIGTRAFLAKSDPEFVGR